MKMNVLKALTILFVLLTLIGAGYVLFHHGQVNAGFACVPMVFAVVCLGAYRSSNKNK